MKVLFNHVSMKLIPQVIVIIIVLALFSCSNSTKSLNENKIFHIDIDKCELSIDLKLSDLIDSCRLVRLETTKDCVLGPYLSYLYISDKYIIIDDRNGIYKFSIDGRFIRKIINVGRGPQEISPNINCFFYEKKNLLFFDETMRRKSFLHVYDIESEKFLEPVKKCFPDTWGDFAIYDDSLIIGSLSPGIWGSMDHIISMDSVPYAIFFQDFNGRFINGILSNKKFLWGQNQNELFQRARIMIGDNNLHIKYEWDDTLFTLNNNKLSPYIIPTYKTPKGNLPNSDPEIGDKRISYKKYENSSFTLFGEYLHNNRIYSDVGVKYEYRKNYFFINKSNGEYAKIKSYTDDFIGHVQEGSGSEIILPSLLSNNKLYVVYNPIDLISKEFGDQDKQELPANIYNQFHSIQKKLNETDNPILLIGTIKKLKDKPIPNSKNQDK